MRTTRCPRCLADGWNKRLLACAALLEFLCVCLTALGQQKPEAIGQANLGVKLAQEGQYGEAVRAYRRAAAIDPTLPNIQLNIGLAWFKAGDFRQAIVAFEKETPSDRVTTLIGMSYFGLAQYKEAAARLKPLVEAQPDQTELAYVLAKCYLFANDGDAATALFRKLLERDPDSAAVHMLMGEAQDAQNHSAEAIKEFAVAAKNAPGQPDVHFGLGYLYWKEKRYEEAGREFAEELKNNPKQAQAMVYLGDVAMKTAKNREAMAALKRAIALEKGSHLAHLDLGILYRQEKRNDWAVREFREAIRADAGSYDAHYRLARLLKELGQTTEAEKEFGIVSKLHEKRREEPLLKITGPK